MSQSSEAKNSVWLPFLLLLFVGLALWLPTCRFDFVWDDQFLVVDNPAIRELGNSRSFFCDPATMGTPEGGTRVALFRPLRNFSYALDHALWGLQPAGWHFHNVLLHLFNAVLLYGLLRRCCKIEAAWAGAALFLVHPVVSETVSWVSCRDDLLAVSFVLLAALAWCEAVQADQKGHRPILWWGVVAMLYVLACLAKIQAVVLPVLLLAVSGLLMVTGRIQVTRLRARSPLALGLIPIAVVMLAWRWAFIGGASSSGGGLGGIRETALCMVPALGHYLRLAIFPFPLLADYSGMEVPTSVTSSGFVIGAVVVGLALVLAELCQRRVPLITLGIGWFLIALLPSLNMIPLPRLVAEHYLYLPLIGLSIAFAGLMTVLNARHLRLVMVLMMLLVAFASAATYSRSRVWQHGLSLSWVTVRDTPERAVRPRINFLNELVACGDTTRAQAVANGLLDSHANGTAQLQQTGLSEVNRVKALGLIRSGHVSAGLTHLQTAMQANSSNWRAFADYGLVMEALGQPEKALAALAVAIRNGAGPHIYVRRANLLMDAGDMDAARRTLTIAVRDAEDDLPASAMVDYLFRIGQPQKADAMATMCRSHYPEGRYLPQVLARHRALLQPPD